MHINSKVLGGIIFFLIVAAAAFYFALNVSSNRSSSREGFLPSMMEKTTFANDIFSFVYPTDWIVVVNQTDALKSVVILKPKNLSEKEFYPSFSLEANRASDSASM